MERHKCKLCSRTFANGRALGGHMKAHLATLPLPPKPQPPPFTDSATSLSYSSSSESEQEYQVEAEEVAQRESDEKALIYGLRENPKKSFRIADPEFSFAPPDTGSSVVVQDRESETESKNPTRQRSKRNRKSSAAVVVVGGENNNNQKKPKLGFMVSTPPPPTTEPEPVSSVSDTSPEEDVAMCLMMLSRDRWWRRRNNNVVVKQEQEEEGCDCEGSVEVKNKVVKLKRVRGKHVCDNCGKSFRSSRALGSHRSICCRDEADKGNNNNSNEKKIFECPFCFKVFGSGQALGGHKRSHLIPSSSSNTVANNNNDSAATRLMKESFIDLNLPAPPEEDDFSVVSDA